MTKQDFRPVDGPSAGWFDTRSVGNTLVDDERSDLDVPDDMLMAA